MAVVCAHVGGSKPATDAEVPAGKIGALAGFQIGGASRRCRETVSRWIPRRRAISRQDSPADRSEWIASTIDIFSTFAMTGLLPRQRRWKTCRSECSMKMTGAQAPITGRLCVPTDNSLRRLAFFSLL
jgi:hypothetical protein